MRKRIIIGLLTGTLVFGAVVGLAASIGSVTSGQLGSGSVAVTSCDSAVNTAYVYNNNGGVSAVTVSGIADGSATPGSGTCDAETVYVELLDSSSAVLTGATGSTGVGAGDINITDDTVTVTMGTAGAAASVSNVRVTITG